MQINFTNIFNINIKVVAITITLLTGIVSCSGPLDSEFSNNQSYPQIKHPEGATLKDIPNNRRVFVFFSLGHNDLLTFLNEDINDLLKGDIPEYGPDKDVVLLLKHGTSAPTLTQIYTRNGAIVQEPLKIYSDTTVATRKSIINDVLTIAKDRFPAKSYGMLLSSHGTGWAPEGYCSSPPDKSKSSIMPLLGPDPHRILTKSIGAHYTGTSSRTIEIEIPDLADAIPMHLDYIIFDACFMGCVEVAYELKDKCDQICFSQTEVMAAGMDYQNLLSALFDKNGIDLITVAENYYNIYKNETSSVYQSATISVVDCKKLDRLARVVAKNSQNIYDYAAIDGSRQQVQHYYRPPDRYYNFPVYHGIFFDLEDIVKKSGASDEDIAELEDALNECILCKFATESFMNVIPIKSHCGLSMYFYDSDRYILNNYYKTLKWEQDVRLIK